MQCSNFSYQSGNWVPLPRETTTCIKTPQLILCFGKKQVIAQPEVYNSLRAEFVGAEIALCSTAGEIAGDRCSTDSVVATGLHFESTRVETAIVSLPDFNDSYEASVALFNKLPQADLIYVMVLSDGSLVNGTQLVKASNEVFGKKIPVTGGMAGDGANFKSSICGLNSVPSEGNILAIGFYGQHLNVTFGTGGGWKPFGSEHVITQSTSNRVYKIDGENAISVYKRRFGSYVRHLPSSMFMYPLTFESQNSSVLVRGVLSFDEPTGAITFAGDIPTGSRVNFAKADFTALIDAAQQATSTALAEINRPPDYVFIVSCVGRRLVLGPGVDEELYFAKSMSGQNTAISGFYSYGEISPFNIENEIHLHSQTFTLTCFMRQTNHSKTSIPRSAWSDRYN